MIHSNPFFTDSFPILLKRIFKIFIYAQKERPEGRIEYITWRQSGNTKNGNSNMISALIETQAALNCILPNFVSNILFVFRSKTMGEFFNIGTSIWAYDSSGSMTRHHNSLMMLSKQVCPRQIHDLISTAI